MYKIFNKKDRYSELGCAHLRRTSSALLLRLRPRIPRRNELGFVRESSGGAQWPAAGGERGLMTSRHRRVLSAVHVGRVDVKARGCKVAVERIAEPRKLLRLGGLRAAHHLLLQLARLLRADRILRLSSSLALLANLCIHPIFEASTIYPRSVFNKVKKTSLSITIFVSIQVNLLLLMHKAVISFTHFTLQCNVIRLKYCRQKIYLCTIVVHINHKSS